jgi:hypothetical protein
MATATKAARKATEPKSTCSHKNAEGVRDCKQPRDPNRRRPSFCVKHELEAAQMRKARGTAKRAAQPAKAKAAPKPSKVVQLRPRKPAPTPERKAHPRIAAMVAPEPTVAKVEETRS